jgi:hypothetical protein
MGVRNGALVGGACTGWRQISYKLHGPQVAFDYDVSHCGVHRRLGLTDTKDS